MTRDIALPVNAPIDQLDQIPLSAGQSFTEVALPWYSDQVLPFDITLAAANEYGAAASCKIFGVEILNEGFGSSIDDSVLEQQATTLIYLLGDFCGIAGATCGPKTQSHSRVCTCRSWPSKQGIRFKRAKPGVHK